jgi:hypothetical protein
MAAIYIQLVGDIVTGGGENREYHEREAGVRSHLNMDARGLQERHRKTEETSPWIQNKG